MLKKRGREINLSEKLTSLIQTKPSGIESDDDDLTTVDKIASNENDSEYSADELDISRFRRINDALLYENDQKYSGREISRRNLDNSPDNDFVESEDGARSETDKGESEVEKDEESGSESEIQPPKSKEIYEKNSKKKRHEVGYVNKEIFLKAASDIEKGKAIKNQLHLWDFLLECRMKFQKCLMASNQFPTFKDFPKFNSLGDPLFQESVLECKKSVKHLLNSLLTFQNELLISNEDFLNSNNHQIKQAEDLSDEEILSDLDLGDIAENNISTINKKFKKLSDFSAEISKRHLDFQTYRNSTIQKWNDKTRIGYISNKNFSAFEQSTLKQIEQVLLDKQRLIRRTQTKRSNYHILGEEDQEPALKKLNGQSTEDSGQTSLVNKIKTFYKEIFDDSDFYHQLLSEMIKRRASDVTDPVQLGRQWMQLQKIRNKMKKAVDTKASKGRKIRFVVHPKLVNFMMPIDSSNYNEESKTELFNSLFGKMKK